MTQTISMFSQIDQVAERRRALAKVYSLLIRLAEEAENQIALPDIVGEEEINNEAGICLDLEFSISDT